MNNGSPPRAWGQSVSQRSRVLLLRFTPTGVGTMYLFAQVDVGGTVHPHGRGDNG